MKNATGFFEDELSTEISKDGVTLILNAKRIEKDQWQLSIQNEYGVSTNWVESFSTAQLAIDAGINAIEDEGIEPFVDTNGFEYLK